MNNEIWELQDLNILRMLYEKDKKFKATEKQRIRKIKKLKKPPVLTAKQNHALNRNINLISTNGIYFDAFSDLYDLDVRTKLEKLERQNFITSKFNDVVMDTYYALTAYGKDTAEKYIQERKEKFLSITAKFYFDIIATIIAIGALVVSIIALIQ